jgi:membrane-associated phospholipid phosphatase
VINRKTFFILYLLFLIGGMILMFTVSQKNIFLWINRHYDLFFDDFFEIYTNAGNGFFAIFIGIVLILFFNIRFGLAVLASFAMEGIIVQVFKQLIYTDRPRPWAEYGQEFQLHLVKNFIPYTNNSFPSGHTATAFCLAAIFILLRPGKLLSWIVFILALLVAYSRIYLSQHYFIDIYVGSLIGVSSAMIIYYYFYTLKPKSETKQTRLDRPLLKISR